jgi:GAF domain-containing protein
MSSKASTNHPLPADSAASEQNIEQLRQEIYRLHTEIETREQENALLNEVISTVGSTLRLEEVLRHLVDTVVRATSCQIALIYLYDKEKERLVLASTNEQYHHLTGKISMALGEGIAGWVAMHQEAVFLTKEAMEDPRFFYFPELEEEKFQSIMTVPIVSKDRNLIGVITVQSIGPREFTEQHRTFMTNTAALVASAIENARLYENTQRKLGILTSLSVLSQTISSGLYLDDMLRSLATMTIQIMEVDQCVIMLLEQGRDRETPPRLSVRASAPGFQDRTSLRSIDIDRQLLDRLREINERRRTTQSRSLHEISDDTLEGVNPLQGMQYKSLVSVPLVAGTEQLGLINCYSVKARRFTSEDQTLLTTIANQTAIAIKNSYLVNQLTQKNIVKGFFEDLMRGQVELEDSLKQRAHFLGCDLNKIHSAVIIEMTNIEQQAIETTARTVQKDQQSTRGASSGEGNSNEQDTQLQAIYRRISSVVRRRIQDIYPGSVFDEHENIITCIIPLRDQSGERLKSWLNDLAQQIYREYEVCLSIGIGNSCQHIVDYRRGFAEAKEALQLGQDLRAWQEEQEIEDQPLVTHFNDLGVYRYLYKIAHMDDLRDVYQEQVARIDRYDKRKNTDLLATLEMYLECAGNLTKTSERLFVHRNTLIQRLERLQALCDIDIQDRSNWLTLQVAIKVYKMRQEQG